MDTTIPSSPARPERPSPATELEEARNQAGALLDEAHQKLIEACKVLDQAHEHRALHSARMSILSCDDARSELVR